MTERALKRAIQLRDNNNLRSNYYQQHPQLQRVGELRSNQAQQNAIRSMQNTRVVVIQAAAYFLSFLITLSMPILRNFPIANFKTNDNEILILRLQIVLMPLQGLFNALIFISHKIYNYRRIHPDVSRCHVLMLVFFGKADDEVLFSRISMISVNDDNSIDINIENERNEAILLFMNRPGRLVNEQEEDFGDFDGEVFLDDEESRYNLSGFSSRLESSTGLSLKEIDTDSTIIDGDPNRENEEEGRRITSLSLGSNNGGRISNGEGTRISSLSFKSTESLHVAGSIS
jgi:hypothetical protein